MTGMAAKIRLAAAVAVAALLTVLVFLSVHPDRLTSWAGVVPLAATAWATFAAGVLLVRRIPVRWAAPVILLGGIAVQLAALSAPPQGSDDLYRYIWDGRVQAAGIDPYAYSPAAPQLAFLRDPFLWPHHVTALRATAGHPAVRCAARPGRPRLHPDQPAHRAHDLPAGGGGVLHLAAPDLPGRAAGTTPIQAAAAVCAIAADRAAAARPAAAGPDPRLAVLWAWCPTVALEAGNNAHVDVLAAFLTAAALLVAGPGGRAAPRRWPAARCSALAIWTRSPRCWSCPRCCRRPLVRAGRGGLFATVVVYLPHVLAVGSRVIGFLPGYLQQEGYSNGTRFLLLGTLVPGKLGLLAAFAVLAVTGLAVLWRTDPDQPWRGAVVMTGAALAVTTPPFPWYTMLLVMLVALDGRAEWLAFAMVKYFAVGEPLPGVRVPIAAIERDGYAAALAVVVLVSLLRWQRGRTQDRGPARPVPVTEPVPMAQPVPAATP